MYSQNSEIKTGTKVRVREFDFFVGGIKCTQKQFIGKVLKNDGYHKRLKDTFYTIRRDRGGCYNIASKYLEIQK